MGTKEVKCFRQKKNGVVAYDVKKKKKETGTENDSKPN